MDRHSLLAVRAAREAMQHAGLSCDEGNPYRFGATVGVCGWGWGTVEETYRDLLLGGAKRAGIYTAPRGLPSAAASQVSMSLGLRGPVFAIASACASANHAIASAADQIRLGRADVMLAGGAEAPLVCLQMKAWEAMRALAPDTCRPFSADRKGVVIGEGAGMSVLESYEHAPYAVPQCLPRSQASAFPATPSTSSRRLSRGRRPRCALALPTPG